MPRPKPKRPKSPRRVAAGRLNRLKRKSLSQATREALRQAAFRNRPWLHTTGPRTAAGKAVSARNGKTRQKGPMSVRERRRELAPATSLLAEMSALRAQLARSVLAPDMAGRDAD